MKWYRIQSNKSLIFYYELESSTLMEQGPGEDVDICNKYNELMAEVEKLKNEALEESHKRLKADRELLSASTKVMMLF